MSRHSFRSGLILLLPFLSGVWTAPAQDVVDISLYRTSNYLQVSDSEPQPTPTAEAGDPFTVLAVMEMSAAFLSDPDNLDFVRATTLMPPTGSLRGLSFFDVFQGFVGYETFTSGAALESAFRAGNYRYTFSSFLTGDEIHDLGFQEGSLLPARQILNFTSTQQVDPALPFTVRWTPESATPLVSEFEVFDTDTGDPVYDSGYREAPTGSVEIPAGVLQPGRIYSAELSITRVDVDDPDRVPVRFASTSVRTGFTLKTAPGGGGAPVITSMVITPDGAARLVVQCRTGIPMEVQRSAVLGSNGQTVLTSLPESSPATLIVPAGILGNLSFLQVVQ